MKSFTPYRRLIREATGAKGDDLGRIENMMREGIFHSTLDWQTPEQLAEGARQAVQRLDKDRDLYDLERECRRALFRKMRAESAFQDGPTKANRDALRRAETADQAANVKLFSFLDLETGRQ